MESGDLNSCDTADRQTCRKISLLVIFLFFLGLVPGFVSLVLGIVSWELGIVFWVSGIVFWVSGFVFWVVWNCLLGVWICLLGVTQMGEVTHACSHILVCFPTRVALLRLLLVASRQTFARRWKQKSKARSLLLPSLLI